MMRKTFVALWMAFAAAAPAAGQSRLGSSAPGPAWQRLKLSQVRVLPVQYEGRVMPLDTLARQVVREVTGRETWGGHDPLALLLEWSWQAEVWQAQPVILVGDPALRKQVGLAEDRRHFSLAELAGNATLMTLLATASDSQEAGEALDASQRTALEVWQRMAVLGELAAGGLLRIVPPVGGTEAAWSPIEEIDQIDRISSEQRGRIQAAYGTLRHAFLADDREGFRRAARSLMDALAALGSPAWPDQARMQIEVFYNMLRPFRAGWALTFLAMTAGLLGVAWPRRPILAAAAVLLTAALLAVTAGLAMRWWFGGHAPFATMYESLVLMGWGAVAMGIVVLAAVRHRVAIPILAGVATAILVIADVTPLDAGVWPLVPMLRNTMWLTYHVLTIMLAYSAFALAMGVGHVQAVMLAYRRRDPEWTARLNRLVYGIILVGCAFLAAGTIFGAVWANQAWGRYWGWDPKETWSLITLLGYAALLHGQLIGWFRAFGVAIGSIICFQLVLMTYYGVNFVLGAGLHSYGFGSGGLGWVLLYVLAECGFVAWMWLARGKRLAPAVASD